MIGTTILCLGSILSDDLTMPIVAFCSQFHVYVKNFPSLFFVPCIGNGEYLLNVYSKNNLVSGNLSQITKLCVNLKLAILKCCAVIPKVVIAKLLVVFNFTVVG